MKAAAAYQAVDGNFVLQFGPRHVRPVSDDLVAQVFHSTTGGGRSALVRRDQAEALRDWLSAWLAEGWDGVQRRCGLRHRPESGSLWLFECHQEPGHRGLHDGPAVGWPSGSTRERRQWS